jgi:phosphohistidine phosphatase
LELYLLRHGDVGKGIVSGGTSDMPITESAKKEIVIVARFIKELNLQITAILTSPLKRATKTAKILSKTLGMEDRISVCSELAPEGSIAKLSEKLHRYPLDSSILIVGHKPYLSDLIYEIIFNENRHELKKRSIVRKQSRTEPSRGIIVKKAGLAKIRLISLTPTMRGEIRWLMTPRVLKQLHHSD